MQISVEKKREIRFFPRELVKKIKIGILLKCLQKFDLHGKSIFLSAWRFDARQLMGDSIATLSCVRISYLRSGFLRVSDFLIEIPSRLKEPRRENIIAKAVISFIRVGWANYIQIISLPTNPMCGRVRKDRNTHARLDPRIRSYRADLTEGAASTPSISKAILEFLCARAHERKTRGERLGCWIR